jgi:hypothetical protein
LARMAASLARASEARASSRAGAAHHPDLGLRPPRPSPSRRVAWARY